MSRHNSVTQQLAEHYGGKWKYNFQACIWECPELDMHAMYTGSDDTPRYFQPIRVYGNGKRGECFWKKPSYENH